MSKPKTPKPMAAEPQPDATVRLRAGEPTDPFFVPTEPKPQPDATVRLKAGEPANPSLPREPEPQPDATVRLKAKEIGDAYATQRLNIEKHLVAADTLKLRQEAEERGATQRIPKPQFGGDSPLRVVPTGEPAQAAGHTLHLPTAPPVPRTFGWKLPLALGALVVLGATTYLVFSRGPALPPPTQPTPAPVAKGEVPAAVQGYLDQAKAGDAHAMRMLGVMYYYGLDVPQDRVKGLYWYRQAADKGSDAARTELQRLEGAR